LRDTIGNRKGRDPNASGRIGSGGECAQAKMT